MYFCEAGSNQFKKGDNCSTKPVISGEQESGFIFTPNNTLSILNLSISPLGILTINTKRPRIVFCIISFQ